jgi:hypothetical protein
VNGAAIVHAAARTECSMTTQARNLRRMRRRTEVLLLMLVGGSVVRPVRSRRGPSVVGPVRSRRGPVAGPLLGGRHG